MNSAGAIGGMLSPLVAAKVSIAYGWNATFVVFGAVYLIGAQGVNRQVLLLYGALPAAVINFVLTEKYRQDPGLAASIVVISTLISLFSIPLVLWLIL